MPSRRPPNHPEIVHEGEEPAYSEDGVDLTLIRWMLSLTPLERLQHLQDTTALYKSRASASQAEGRGFETRFPLNKIEGRRLFNRGRRCVVCKRDGEV
jgi:hypothetical protein